MALARIISHSHQYSRELALDLLARGYTVEIVPPDKIPNNAADLELRVDSNGAGGAPPNITLRDGGHTSSPNFAGQAKTLTDNLGQRPAEAGGATRFAERTAHFDAGPRLLGEGWFWRASAAFAAVIVLAGALAMGVRRSEEVSVAQKQLIDLPNVAVAANPSTLAAPQPQLTASPANRKSAAAASLGASETALQTASPKAEMSQRVPPLESSLRQSADLRLDAAVINRDKPATRVATQNSPQKTRHENDLIAPDTVTYLEGAVTAKARVQTSNGDVH